jgi:hypothetical protein
MASKGYDPGFVGPSYQAAMVLQDAENCINWYPEIAEVDGAKEVVALLGAPGLNAIISTTTGQIRGMWPLPGGATALVVAGANVYLVTVTTQATATQIAQFATTLVGTMQTNSGPVCIRDNGVIFNGEGGYAIIVDGTVTAYYYNMLGPSTVQFTGGVALSSGTLSLPGTLPSGLVLSTTATLSDTSGFIQAGTYISSINYALPALAISKTATGSNASETITLSIPQFGTLTDPGFLGASRIAFIEGWLIFNQPATRTFFTTGPTPYTINFPGTSFALKDSSTDNLITLFENDRELWLIGERTSEVWYNAGNSTGVSFSRVPAVGPQIGCSAQHSISRMGPSLVWLAQNEQGQNVVVQTNQYAFDRISNHAIETAIASYPLVSDAIGYVYEEGGHVFYVLTFPTADVTWVYDMTASEGYGKPTWHQRASYNSATGQFHRHRGNCFMNFQNLRLVGDYQTGQIHQMSRAYYTDNGSVLKSQRRAKPIWDKSNRERIFHASLQVEFTPGVGVQSGQGSTPEAMLRWSDDGGFTWSNEHWQSIGAAGYTKNRAKWNRLGASRDRIYELNFTDPVPRDVIGATLFAENQEEAANG